MSGAATARDDLGACRAEIHGERGFSSHRGTQPGDPVIHAGIGGDLSYAWIPPAAAGTALARTDAPG